MTTWYLIMWLSAGGIDHSPVDLEYIPFNSKQSCVDALAAAKNIRSPVDPYIKGVCVEK